MAGRRTNLAILVLLLASLLTGALAFAVGTGWVRWILIAHGAVALGIVVLAPWKSTIARRGLRRGRPGRSASVLLAVLVVATVITGVLHATGLVSSTGTLSPMGLHVAAALATVPVAIYHLVRRPVRPRAMDLSRRNLLRSGALAGGAALAYVAIEGTVRAAGFPGEDRRFTGSHETGSFHPGEMPVTQWFNDRVPAIDPSSWTLEVHAGETSRAWTYEELAGFDDRTRATIDCTGGWFATQDWEGVLLSRLIPEAVDAESVLVRSATGYARRLPTRDVPGLMLAIRAGGEALEPGHGFPARLVAPGRRGFWWVKWVVALEADDTPWWWQAPFPLS